MDMWSCPRIWRMRVLFLAFLLCMSATSWGQAALPVDIGSRLARQLLAMSSQENGVFTFQGCAWGTEFVAVREKVQGTLEQEVDRGMLGYRVLLPGMVQDAEFSGSLYVVYAFDDAAKLAAVTSYFVVQRDIKEQYQKDFEAIVTVLQQRYGPEDERITEFAEGVDPESAQKNLAQAYENDDAKTIVRWTLPGATSVVALIGGDEAGTSLSVTYSYTQ